MSCACTRSRRTIALGFMLFAAAVSSAPAHAQQTASVSTLPAQNAVNVDPITVMGRVQRTVVPSVFGTVAVPFGTTPMSARWTRVISASVNDASLVRLTAGARDLAPYQKAAFIQSVVNRSVRNHSRPKCTDDGYWAAARESLARGIGDCVDIAIAKMEALRQLGFPTRDLYLITGRTFSSNGLEAALLVRIGEQFYMLDSRSDQIVEAGSSGFTPIVTYGAGMTWAHGVAVSSKRMATKSLVPLQTAQQVERPRPFTGLDAGVKSAIRSLAPSR